MRWKSLVAVVCVMGASALPGLSAHAQTSQPIAGYQCMSLAHLWDGQGPQPPPVHVYAAPEPNAPVAGIAGGTVIVASPMKVTDGRVQMLMANGKPVWIETKDIVPFHVVSNPHAICHPVILSNGRYGVRTVH